MIDGRVENAVAVSDNAHGVATLQERSRFVVTGGMLVDTNDIPGSTLTDDEYAGQPMITEAERQGLGPRDPSNQYTSSGRHITCLHCGRDDVLETLFQVGMCVDCYVKISNRNTELARWGNQNWREAAEAAGVRLYEQLPNETPFEYRRFCVYRDLYPSTRPTVKEAARLLNEPYATVLGTSSRWHWHDRLQEWINECDRITLEQRRQEMLDMNKRHIELARIADSKVRAALESMDPRTMKPSEVNSLIKTMAQLERESRVDTIAQEELRSQITHGSDNPELKKSPTKVDEMGDVLNVLLQAGVLDSASIGLKTTSKDGSVSELVVKKEQEAANA